MTLDPSKDPDRFDPAKAESGEGRTLPELLGETGDERDNLQWLVGLLSVFGFLLLVTLLLHGW